MTSRNAIEQTQDTGQEFCWPKIDRRTGKVQDQYPFLIETYTTRSFAAVRCLELKFKGVDNDT